MPIHELVLFSQYLSLMAELGEGPAPDSNSGNQQQSQNTWGGGGGGGGQKPPPLMALGTQGQNQYGG